MTALANCKRTDPIIPVGHPNYVWRSHTDTDVQRTWRRYGWVPLAERKAQPKPLRVIRKAGAA